MAFALCFILSASLQAAALDQAFDQANKLYEEGKFPEAAAAYEQLLQTNGPSAALYFNLGNAWYKADQLGRAIAAYRQAEALEPRDPNLRFNLQFTRKKVIGGDTLPGETWRERLDTLTLNEWTALAAGAFWTTFLLLALGEVRPGWRKSLRVWTLAAGASAVLLGACLIAAMQARSRHDAAVVVAPQAIVRYGPLDESQVFYQLRDGSEVTVLDEKKLDNQPAWVQVRDAARRVGWVKRDQLLRL